MAPDGKESAINAVTMPNSPIKFRKPFLFHFTRISFTRISLLLFFVFCFLLSEFLQQLRRNLAECLSAVFELLI